MPDDLFYRVSVQAGAAAYDLSEDLASLTVEEESSKPAYLTINLGDPYKVFSHALQEGMQVEVEMGTVKDHSVVFRGQIYKVDGEFPEQEVPTLRLLAYDKSQKMGLRRRNRPFTDVSLSELVTRIAKPYFGARNVIVKLKGDPSFSGNGIRQQNETDLAFLLRLAAAYGCEMFVIAGDREDELHFEAQYTIMKATPQVTLTHGRCDVPGRLMSFQASSDVSDIQLPRVFSGIDYDTGQKTEVTTAPAEQVADTKDTLADDNLAEFRSRHPDRADALKRLLSAAPNVRDTLHTELGSVVRETTPGFTTAEAQSVRRDNQFSTSLLGMRGSGATPGNHRIRAQSSIALADLGGRFSGKWYLSQVRHILNDRGYQTEFQCRR